MFLNSHDNCHRNEILIEMKYCNNNSILLKKKKKEHSDLLETKSMIKKKSKTQ